ncbi:leucine-rich repeat protein [Butyrivibrio sp. AD3002]|uniref:leucine-rich repeat protein n=1 Tax=Butyrivibrio sp. AD3002 TaxID=1280670 RepID=UPI0003B4DC6D|nr:leucine-rich repeat domain-containing protein [Butyrivibrio sp. AD3002]
MKKLILHLAAVFFIMGMFNIGSIQSRAYYDNYYKVPKGGEFVYEGFVYRVVKPIKNPDSFKKFRIGEVELAGFDPACADKYTLENPSIVGIEEDLPYDFVGIADDAFKGNTNIRSFGAYGCTNFRYVGKSAFEGCTKLEDFSTNRKGLATIGDRAFYGCESLNEVYFTDDSLKSVGTDAFANTSQIIRVYTYDMSTKHASKINKLLKKAGAKDVYFIMDTPKKEKTKTKIPTASDFMKKLSKGETFVSGSLSYRVVKTATKKQRGEVEVIGFNSSASQEDMERFDPWKYVDEIGYECYDVVGIADNAFKGNQYIKDCWINETKIKYIGKSAFEGCTQLEDVNIIWSKDFSAIKARAFYGCSSLKEMGIHVNTVKKVGKDAFAGTPSKIKVEVENMNSKEISNLKQMLKKAGMEKARYSRCKRIA